MSSNWDYINYFTAIIYHLSLHHVVFLDSTSEEFVIFRILCLIELQIFIADEKM